MVAHSTGYIHSVYPEATIAEDAYTLLKNKLSGFLDVPVNFEIFTNFLRSASRYQKLFQLSFQCLDQTKYIRLEKAFAYEHDSKNKIGDKTAKKLFCEIDEEDLSVSIEKERAVIAADNFIFSQKTNKTFFTFFQQEFPSHPVTISPLQSRDEIIGELSGIRKHSVTTDLAFYAGRQMDSCDWKPFLKAAFERNPVSVDYFREMKIDQVYMILSGWPDESIYDGNGLAMPDEVVNYRRGEGVEKAITFANIAKSRHLEIIREHQDKKIILKIDHHRFEFPYTKKLKPEIL
jgi:hypothetical protein